jgi:response regulator of citrate/malate metabolism
MTRPRGTSGSWRVLVVEDDPTVARVHCRLVADTPGFDVLGVARSGAEGRRMVEVNRPDLLLLDFGLPGGDGLTLLRQIRAAALAVEVIAVTAASSSDVIRATLHLGVVDYLVKPFEPERLRQALSQFVQRMAVLGDRRLEQAGVDALRSTAAPAKRWIPKDLSQERLTLIRDVVLAAEEPLTADDVAGRTGIARVTARRYLEYLVTIGQASWSAVPSGPGRPRKVYEAGPAARVSDAPRPRPA